MAFGFLLGLYLKIIAISGGLDLSKLDLIGLCGIAKFRISELKRTNNRTCYL